MQNKALAILSPNQNAYSETFIHALKKLPFNVKFYYGGSLPTHLEGDGSLQKLSLKERIEKKIKKRFTLYEYGLFYSFKRENIDCVLAEYGPTASASFKVIKALNLPLVVHFHGWDASINEILNKYKNGYKLVFEYAKAVIAVSKKMYNDLVALGCPAGKIHLIICGAETEFFKVQHSFISNQFIAIGRFVDKKAPYLTLASFKKVLDIYPDATLIMGGDGPLLNACINLAKAWHIEKNVEFTGKMSHAEVIKHFAASLAFVQHSVVALTGDSEGTPVAITEAMAAGLPVIATNHAGITDVITNDETGLLTEEMNIDGMANNMITIFRNRELAKKLGNNAKTYAETNLTMHQYLDKISNVIKSSCNQAT